MTNTIINRRDLEFQLFELLNVESLTAHPRYAEHSKETFLAVLDTAWAMATEKFAPHNRQADEHEPTFDGQRVSMIPAVKQALKAFCEAGFIAAAHDFERGGMQLPVLMAQASFSLFTSANIATAAYPFLTIGNANVIHRFGTPAQHKKYLEPLLTGRFFGTMALTEPQAGSSLSDIGTSATPNADGTYSLRGNKIFISAGDHDLSENIVHLVLTRIPGGPPGVKGISLFIVPKYRVNDDGTLGERNDVTLTGLIHKMGYRGTTSTLLAFGEKGACSGELVGLPHQGLSCMFHMMNEARIGVGMGAVMLGYRGYLASLDYAKERLQGRALAHKNPSEPQVPIIEHTDVRRMLLAQKAYVEGGYALCLYCARLVDEQKVGSGDTANSAATEAGADPVLAGHATELGTALEDVAATLQALAPVLTSNPTLALANAVLFLEAFGHTVIAWIWLRQALAAQRGLAQGNPVDAAFYRGKLAACRWFYRWELPKTRQWHELLRSLDDTPLTMRPENF